MVSALAAAVSQFSSDLKSLPTGSRLCYAGPEARLGTATDDEQRLELREGQQGLGDDEGSHQRAVQEDRDGLA